MIPDFKTFINERLWTTAINRGIEGRVKKEDGKKVHTCLGIDAIVKNYSCDIDDFIKEICNLRSNDVGHIDIDLLRFRNLSNEEIFNIKEFKAPYDYLIYDGRYGTSLVARFTEYEEMPYDDNDILKEDYITVCRTIAERLKQIGQYIESSPSIHTTPTSYGGDYTLILTDESTVWNWECKQDKNEIDILLNDFKNDLYYEFPELEDEDIITWSYQHGCYYALPINFNNIKNFEKYREFTQNWFKS